MPPKKASKSTPGAAKKKSSTVSKTKEKKPTPPKKDPYREAALKKHAEFEKRVSEKMITVINDFGFKEHKFKKLSDVIHDHTEYIFMVD